MRRSRDLTGGCRQRLDDSRDWLTEAAGLARRTGELDTMGMFFGPTNVDIWRMSIEVDDGGPALVVEIAQRTDPAVIPAGVRQVYYYADTARAPAEFNAGSSRVKARSVRSSGSAAPSLDAQRSMAASKAVNAIRAASSG